MVDIQKELPQVVEAERPPLVALLGLFLVPREQQVLVAASAILAVVGAEDIMVAVEHMVVVEVGVRAFLSAPTFSLGPG
jgi:hypothetical protein